MRSESLPELFPLTGEELSDDVFEILIVCSRHLVQNIVKISMFRNVVEIPVFQKIVEIPVFRKLMCVLKIEIVSDR